MLTHTFCHIPGIGPRTEQGLWRRGIRTWQDYLAAPQAGGRAMAAGQWLERSLAALEQGDAAFFADALPAAEAWRLVSGFGHAMAFVDIETDGLADAEITTIALNDGRRVRTYVQGRNLADFEADIQPYRLLVTFNGRTFDAPIIERHFRMRLPRAHVDLRYVLAALGHKGGLKACEKRLGMCRGDLDGVDGYFAVLLWHEYQTTGDERALETLLAYNAADVVHLPELLRVACNLRLAATGLELPPLPAAILPPNPHTACPEVIHRLRVRYGL